MHGVAAQDERRDQNDRPENRLAKKILAPMLGQADPFKALPQDREVADAPSS
jgi:hypothetical protein